MANRPYTGLPVCTVRPHFFFLDKIVVYGRSIIPV